MWVFWTGSTRALYVAGEQEDLRQILARFRPLGAPIEISTLDPRLLALSDEQLAALKGALLKVREAEELAEAEPE